VTVNWGGADAIEARPMPGYENSQERVRRLSPDGYTVMPKVVY